jgi:hypothetical protein
MSEHADHESARELDPLVDLSGWPAEVETEIYELRTLSELPVNHLVIRLCSACGSSEPHHLAYIEKHGICVV